MMKLIYGVFTSCLLLQACTFAKPYRGKTNNSFVTRVGFDPASIETILDKEYYFNPQVIGDTAFRAQAYCNDIGMQLLSLETVEETIAINNFLNAKGDVSSFWTSGEKWQNTWRWTGSGRLFTFTNWNALSDEPNYTGSGDVCVWFTSAAGWYDGPCLNSLRFICEVY